MQTIPQPVILCPGCKKDHLTLDSNPNNEIQCSGCSASYPQKNGVFDLIPEFKEKRSLAQYFMEWKPLIKIYESRFWRQSSFFSIFTGISFKEEYEMVIQTMDIKGGEMILDLACGSGIYTRPIAQKLKNGCIVGLDISIPMLDYASNKVNDENLKNIILIHGNALNLPFSNNEFHAVSCCGAVHLFPELTRVLSEINRVLKTGGRFTAAVFLKTPGRIGEYAASLHRMIGVNSFSPDELEQLLNQAGFNHAKCLHAKGVWMIMSATKPA